MIKNRKVSIIIILIAIIVYAISSFSSYYAFSMKDAKNIEYEYKIKKEKHDLLVDIRNKVVDEDRGMDVKQIPGELFTFELKIDKNGSYLTYTLKEDIGVCANIVLDTNYKIIDEIYKPNINCSFEEYKSRSNLNNISFSFGFCGLMAAFVFLGCYTLVLTILDDGNDQKNSQV